MSNFFKSMDIAASGMSAERFRMDIIASNISNVNTVNQVTGEPYRRKFAMVDSENQQQPFMLPVGVSDEEGMENTPVGEGVRVVGVREDNSESSFKHVYDPTNPRAEQEGKWKGYVKMPNINIINEMTNLIAASRAYEANATVIQAAKQMAQKGSTLGK
ncbi:MAG: flagellar basal body rod protein FlgC [Vulcanimicrobiota bacterium]